MRLNKVAMAFALSWLIAAPALAAYELFHVPHPYVYDQDAVVFCTRIIPAKMWHAPGGHMGLSFAQCAGQTDFDGAVAAVARQTLDPRLKQLAKELAQAKRNDAVLTATVDALKAEVEGLQKESKKDAAN